jgi:PAS domain S-box-containing protein
MTPSHPTALERLPWPFRALLGWSAAAASIALTWAITPFRAFPFLLAFPTVILAFWFLDMAGGVVCAVTEAVLVDALLTKDQFRFSLGFVRQETRLAVFLTLTILLGWAIRRLASQRSTLATQELQQRLGLANAERLLAEERARASETLRDRDEILQIALQANHMGLWVWNLLDDTIQWSDEVYRIFGTEPGAVRPGYDTNIRFLHPDDAHIVSQACTHALFHPDEPYHTQYRIFWPDGSIRWIESQGKTQLDPTGHPTRIVGVVADITARKLSQDAMLRAEKLAVAGRLAASIAHEINNPLEAIANLLYLILHADSPNEASEHAAIALDELMRVSLITQQTLKFHRQSGAPKPTLLSEVLQTVLTLFRGKLAASQVKVDLRVEREVPIACMPSEIQQVLANLVGNSIEAMPNGGRLLIRIRPSCDWRDGRTQGIRLTLLDTGTGMDRNTMRRIFEPFFTTKTDTGTGLGMWVVAQLTERHHGHLRVASSQSPGRSGTAFSLFLPLEALAALYPAGQPAAAATQ